MDVLQIVFIFFIFAALCGLGIFYVTAEEKARRNRVFLVVQGQSGGMVSAPRASSQQEDQNRRRAEIAQKLKDSKQVVSKGKKKISIGTKIEQAGLKISVRKFWIYSAISLIIGVLGAVLTHRSPLVVLLIAITFSLGVPRFVLRRLAKRRQKKFLDEFADALEGMIRLLKAGMPISEAISMVAREFGGPVGEEMSRIYDKQKIGIPLHEAAFEATKRMPLPEMQLFATGLAIQAQTGSSMSEVLKNLAGLIRARYKLKRKIKALSSEAIASAGIIGALPNIVCTGLYFVNYDYLSVMFTTPTGNMLLGVAVGMMLFGIMVMKIMINFKI